MRQGAKNADKFTITERAPQRGRGNSLRSPPSNRQAQEPLVQRGGSDLRGATLPGHPSAQETRGKGGHQRAAGGGREQGQGRAEGLGIGTSYRDKGQSQSGSDGDPDAHGASPVGS
jgi:hypothetical protein